MSNVSRGEDCFDDALSYHRMSGEGNSPVISLFSCIQYAVVNAVAYLIKATAFDRWKTYHITKGVLQVCIVVCNLIVG